MSLGSSANQYMGIDANGYHKWSNGSQIYAQNYSSSLNALYNGQWRHIVVTVNGSEVKTYVDGTLAQSTSICGDPGA